MFFFFLSTPTKTSGSNKGQKLWARRVASVLTPERMAVFSAWPPPGSGSQKCTQPLCTLALLLMLYCILLSSCTKSVCGSTLTAYLAPKMENKLYTEDLLACKQAITDTFLLSHFMLKVGSRIFKNRMSMITAVHLGKRQPD